MTDDVNKKKREVVGRIADKRADIFEDNMVLQLVTPSMATGFAKIRHHGERFMSLEMISEEEYIKTIKGE